MIRIDLGCQQDIEIMSTVLWSVPTNERNIYIHWEMFASIAPQVCYRTHSDSKKLQIDPADAEQTILHDINLLHMLPMITT